MAVPADYDNPDLWARIKTAKDQLFANTSFMQKYRTPASATPPKEPITKFSQPEVRVPGIVKGVTSTPGSKPFLPETQKPKQLLNLQDSMLKVTAPDPRVTESTSPVMAGLHQPKQITAPSSSPHVNGSSQKLRPRPCIPLTRAEAISRARKGNFSSSQESPTPCVARAVVEHDPATPSSQRLQRIKNLPHTPHTPSPLAGNVETSSSPPVKPPKAGKFVTLGGKLCLESVSLLIQRRESAGLSENDP